MIEIRKKLKVKAGAYPIETKGRLELPFEQRVKSRSKAALVGGEEVALHLPRGEVLRGGDLVVASDGRVIEVHATPESVLHITCASPGALLRVAYQLGDRHVAVEVGDGWLSIAADHVIEDLLRGLGAKLESRQAAFEPDPGTYDGEGHSHHEHADEHGHVHGPDSGHDHGHAHAHDQDHKDDHKRDHKHDPKHDHARDTAPAEGKKHKQH